MIYVWLAVIVASIIVEVVVPGLVAIWFVPSALISMLLDIFNVPEVIQVIVFLALSILFILLFRRYFAKSKKVKTNIDAVLGERCVVTENIDNIHGTGKVKLKGMDWTARSENEEERYEIDDIVTVCAVEGVKLIVKK